MDTNNDKETFEERLHADRMAAYDRGDTLIEIIGAKRLSYAELEATVELSSEALKAKHAEMLAAVSEMKDDNGKLRFTNEASRQAETLARLSTDNEYLVLRDAVRTSAAKLVVSRIHIDALSERLKLIRAFLTGG